MMQMRSVEYETEFPAPVDESAEQRHRVSSPGEAYGKAHAGLQQRRVERECGRCAHERMIEHL